MIKVSEKFSEEVVLDVMQDDIFALSAEIDCLLDLFRALKAGRALPMEMVDEMLSSAEETSDEILSRWRDVEFADAN